MASPPPRRLVIASRQSALAMWQANHVQALLRQRYPSCDVSILSMTTRGDQILDRSLSKIGGKGLFTKELEIAIEDRRADLAVHSLKDVPMELPPGFVLAATLKREDPRDAFVSSRYANMADLPAGARVGTSSLRRAAQVRHNHPRLQILELRGNVNTRLGRLDAGEYDAIILAAAGLKRLGMADRIRALLPPDESLPAVGQGVLGVEIRSDRGDLADALAHLTDPLTWLQVSAERAVSRQLGGSCQMPLAAYCELFSDQIGDQIGEQRGGSRLRLRAMVASPDGSQVLHAQAQALVSSDQDAVALASAVTSQLIAAGALTVLASSG